MSARCPRLEGGEDVFDSLGVEARDHLLRVYEDAEEFDEGGGVALELVFSPIDWNAEAFEEAEERGHCLIALGGGGGGAADQEVIHIVDGVGCAVAACEPYREGCVPFPNCGGRLEAEREREIGVEVASPSHAENSLSSG